MTNLDNGTIRNSKLPDIPFDQDLQDAIKEIIQSYVEAAKTISPVIKNSILKNNESFRNLSNSIRLLNQSISSIMPTINSFNVKMDFDSFQKFSDEFSVLAENVIYDEDELNNEQNDEIIYEYLSSPEKITQAFSNIHDQSLPSVIKEKLSDQLLTFLIYLLFQILPKIITMDIEFDLGKEIVSIIITHIKSIID